MNQPSSTAGTCDSAGHLQEQAAEKTEQGGEQITQSSLALLRQLEASLLASQQALLAGDAAALESATDEQRRLRQALAILWAPAAKSPQTIPRPGADGGGSSAAELRAAQIRVLHSGRILAALVVRAERLRRAFSTVLLRPEPAYGPLRNSFATDGQASSRVQEGDSCRA